MQAAATYLWQVAVHSSVMGLIFYIWVHRVGLPSGRTKRRLLATLLVLPLITAAVPWRSSLEFGERVAWINTGRVLAIPLPLGFQVVHLALLFGATVALLTLWQEVVPAFRHPKAGAEGVPDWLIAFVRSKPGWNACTVLTSPELSILLATSGVPGRPRVIVSRGALESLTRDDLDMVLSHEHAHWDHGGWVRSHALFAVRMLQAYNPVALWVFREYCIEVEVGCDAVAVTGRDPKRFARVLLGIYESTDRRDVAARAAIRKRVDVLLAGGPLDDALPSFTLNAATVLMLMVLPWLV